MTLEAIKEAISELPPEERTALADWLQDQKFGNGICHGAADNDPTFGRMKGTITILGDIIGPTGERWEADE